MNGFVIFAGISVTKLNVFKFHSMSILAIRCKRQQETVSMPRYSLKQKNWTIILGIQLRRQGVAFYKIANCWFARDVTTAMLVVQSISLLWKLK